MVLFFFKESDSTQDFPRALRREALPETPGGSPAPEELVATIATQLRLKEASWTRFSHSASQPPLSSSASSRPIDRTPGSELGRRPTGESWYLPSLAALFLRITPSGSQKLAQYKTPPLERGGVFVPS